MVFRLLADATVIVHLGFVVFVICGGVLALRWRRVAWVHVPAAAWGAWVEFAGWTARSRRSRTGCANRAARRVYTTGFVERYLLPVLYPSSLSRDAQWVLGGLVIVVNAVVYAVVLRSRRGRMSR